MTPAAIKMKPAVRGSMKGTSPGFTANAWIVPGVKTKIEESMYISTPGGLEGRMAGQKVENIAPWACSIASRAFSLESDGSNRSSSLSPPMPMWRWIEAMDTSSPCCWKPCYQVMVWK